MSTTRSITITANEAEQRIDRFVRKLLDDVSLSAIYKLLRTKQITLNGKKARPEKRLQIDDVVTFRQAAEDRHLAPKIRKKAADGLSKRRDFEVIFEDTHFVAVNKPAGLLVHAGDRGDGRDTLIDQVTGYLVESPTHNTDADLKNFVRPSPTFAPTLIHRLDRQTSGLVLVGKTLEATQKLTAMVKKRRVKKTYVACTIGGLPQREGTINVPIQRQESAKGQRRKVKAGEGKRAVTHYKVLAQAGHFSVVEVDLETGRTHQIRAHMAHLGAPIVGDDEYGSRDQNRHAAKNFGIKRQFLHAARLQFTHPIEDTELSIQAPLWPDLNEALDRMGFKNSALPSWLMQEIA
ncbi:RluA family pseudouridine synthase [Planctomycetota bacterium]|nr:RluA family pseudouridine synthase [Planctomycetota bacterium]